MERRAFEVKVGDYDLALELGNCACVLFRSQQEVDYLAIDVEDDQTLRIFNNVDFVRWLAGYSIAERDGNIYRPTTRNSDLGNATFREFIATDGGEPWGPAVIEREAPNDREVEMWVEINASDLDGEREW